MIERLVETEQEFKSMLLLPKQGGICSASPGMNLIHIDLMPVTRESIKILGYILITLPEIMEDCFHLKKLRCIIRVRGSLTRSFPNTFGCVIEKEFLADVIFQGIDEPRHDHVIVIPRLKLGVILLWGSNNTFAANKHHDRVRPL